MKNIVVFIGIVVIMALTLKLSSLQTDYWRDYYTQQAVQETGVR